MPESPWSVDVMTLFPQWFGWLDEVRPIRNVRDAGELELAVHDMRAGSALKHRQADDTPYGGGAGMVIRVDVVVASLEAAYGCTVDQLREKRRVVVLTPAGRQFDDALARSWAAERRPTTLLCGRYEGFDHRVHDHVATEELSVGPYVLSGGEPAAMAVIDAIARKLPGGLGNQASLQQETFSHDLEGGSEYPHYTRPPEFRGWAVPDLLVTGHHARIEAWRREQSRLRTGRAEHGGDEQP